jgi:hypothetical protein
MSKLLTKEALKEIVWKPEDWDNGTTIDSLIKAINEHVDAVIGEDDAEYGNLNYTGIQKNKLRAKQRENGKIL